MIGLFAAGISFWRVSLSLPVLAGDFVDSTHVRYVAADDIFSGTFLLSDLQPFFSGEPLQPPGHTGYSMHFQATAVVAQTNRFLILFLALAGCVWTPRRGFGFTNFLASLID
jgi:hypothetical protein